MSATAGRWPTTPSSMTAQLGQATATVDSAGGAGVIHADVGDAALAGHVRQGRAAAAAATARTQAGAFHLDVLDAERVENRARALDLAVVAAEIAGVVIGDAGRRASRRP